MFNNGRSFRRDLGRHRRDVVWRRGPGCHKQRNGPAIRAPVGISARRERHGTATRRPPTRLHQKLARLGGDRGATETNVARRSRPSHLSSVGTRPPRRRRRSAPGQTRGKRGE